MSAQSHGAMEDLHPLDQASLYYETHGTGDPILFLHGFGANIYAWRHIVAPLSKHYQLILVDLKGFDASPKPDDKKYSISDQADLISQFIVKHNLKNLTIVGHSFGGGVALLTAIQLSENGSNRLSALILIDSIAYKHPSPYLSELSEPLS
jgi:pimeloyl-ACP methyl ester carboxylesterase